MADYQLIHTGAEIDAALTKVKGLAAVASSGSYADLSGRPSSLPANGGTANYLNANSIPEKANLNSYTTPGYYYCPANATVATLVNAPTGNAFFLMVGKHAGTYQRLVEHVVSGAKIYARNYYSSGWGAWCREYTTMDKPTLAELGAAAAAHGHTAGDISSGTLPLARGGTGAADAAAARTALGITLANLGAAPSSHSHPHSAIAINSNTNAAGSLFYTDRGYIDNAGACRTAFMPAAAIVLEYTTDNGATWVNYGASDTEKMGLFSMNRGFTAKLGGKSATAQTVGHGVRVTVSPTDRYSSADTFYCWFNDAGSTCNYTIEMSTIGAKTTFVTLRSKLVADGWSGPNIATFPEKTFGGGTGQTSNGYAFRFTFVTATVPTASADIPTVTDLRLYGTKVWNMPNRMMENGHLYGWDTGKNAVFPAKMTATEFSGPLSGNAATATTASKTQGALSIGGKSFNGSAAVVVTLADLGAAAANHGHPVDASRAPLASPTFTGTARVTANTAYGTAQLRNIYAGTGAMTAGTTALENGAIYCQYE